MRKILLFLAFAMSTSAIAQAQLKDLPEDTFQSSDEESAVETVREPLSRDEQRAVFQGFVERILDADSERARLRAHADLLDRAEDLPDVLRYAVSRSNPDSFMRSVAAWTLGERGTAQACDALRGVQISREEPLTALSIATAKGRCGDTSDLRTILAGNYEYTRARAAVALGMVDDRRALSTIRANAQAENEHQKFYILAQGLLGDRSVHEQLVEMLSDREYYLHAAIALSRQGADYVVYDLQAATRSPESMVRWAATRELTSRKLPGTCDVLDRLVEDSDERVMKLSDGVLARWRGDAEAYWLREGFNMMNFNSRAYCP